jgi:pimeloyl-ACP methyl ester carboxylesterase
MRKQRLSLHGHDIALFHEGSGPVVLLIHGMAGSADTWRAVLPSLAEHFTVVAPDLPGNGASQKYRADYSLGGFATTLRDLLLLLGYDHATVVGQSFGGGVALQFAHQFPEQCERLVLVGSGGLGPEVHGILRMLSVPGTGWMLTVGCNPVVNRAVQGVGHSLEGLGVHVGPALREVGRSYTSLADAAAREALLITLRSVVDLQGQRLSATEYFYLSVDLPTLIVWGDADPIIPVQHAYAAHERLKDSRLEIFPGVGHYPHCEDPERFLQVFTDFARSSARRAMTVQRRRQLMLAAG